MKNIDQQTKQLLVLLKLDAQRLFERIKYRAPEYLGVFSARRVRDHFPDIFKNRYHVATLELLSRCSEEVIVGLDQFYTRADDLQWYLANTQDMPMKVSDHVYHIISELEDDFATLSLYIDAELGVRRDNESLENAQEEDLTIPSDFEISDDFTLSSDNE
jgi:hypothetical protein